MLFKKNNFIISGLVGIVSIGLNNPIYGSDMADDITRALFDREEEELEESSVTAQNGNKFEENVKTHTIKVTAKGDAEIVIRVKQKNIRHGKKAKFLLFTKPGFVLEKKIAGTCPKGKWFKMAKKSYAAYETNPIFKPCQVVFSAKKYTEPTPTPSAPPEPIVPNPTITAHIDKTMSFMGSQGVGGDGASKSYQTNVGQKTVTISFYQGVGVPCPYANPIVDTSLSNACPTANSTMKNGYGDQKYGFSYTIPLPNKNCTIQFLPAPEEACKRVP